MQQMISSSKAVKLLYHPKDLNLAVFYGFCSVFVVVDVKSAPRTWIKSKLSASVLSDQWNKDLHQCEQKSIMIFYTKRKPIGTFNELPQLVVHIIIVFSLKLTLTGYQTTNQVSVQRKQLDICY